MRASEMLPSFTDFLAGRSLVLDRIAPEDLLAAMADWYVADRIEDADSLDDGGDMLLIQSGTYDWDETGQPSWEFNITRQAITVALADDDEEEMWQFGVTFSYADTVETRQINEEGTWCETPAEVDQFLGQARDSAGFSYAIGRTARTVEGRNERV